jgi:hypothetical protein
MPKDHAVQWDDELFEVVKRAAELGERPIGAQIRHYVKRGLKQDGLLPSDGEAEGAELPK